MSVAVRMRTTSAGPEGVVRAGAIVRVGSEEAAALVAGGYADLVPEERATLTATRDAAQPAPAGAPAAPQQDPPAPSGPMALSGPSQALVAAAPTSAASATTAPVVGADVPAAASGAVESGDPPTAPGGVVDDSAGDDSWTSDAPQALASAAAAEGRRGKRSAG